MALRSVNAESMLATPTSLLSLYELDTRFISVNGDRYFLHAGVNGLYQPVIWRSQPYTPFPIEVEGFDIDGSGGIPRPKVSVSNINGAISQLLLTQGGLVGAKFTRTQVYARFLDNANWARGNPWGTPDPLAAYEPEVYFVSRTITENPEMVQWELQTPFELDNVKLPRRPILSILCSFQYRDPETCGYTGVPVMDRFGKSFTEAAPEGYGYTLNLRGFWSPLDTYNTGDWVYVTSENDFSYGDTLVYVCAADGTAGSFNNPQFNPTNWVADACPQNLLGCDGHFDSPLPFGGYMGTARAPFAQ